MKLKTNKVEELYEDSKTTAEKETANPSSHKETLKEVLYIYSGSTTLHCICHLSNRDYSWWRRAFWIILFMVFVAGFSYELFVLCARYFEYHTVTNTITLYENKAEFPAVTICNLNKIDNDSVTDPDIRQLLKETYLKEFINMTYFNSLNTTFINSVNLTHFFVSQPRLNSTALFCQWEMTIIPCEKYFYPVMTNYGNCLTFNSKGYIKDHSESLRLHNIGSEGGLIVTLMAYQEQYFIGDSAAAGFKVVVHDPNEEPGVREVGLVISPGTSTQLGLKKIETIYLPSPVKAFGDKYCLDTESSSFSNFLKTSGKYSFQACLAECESDYTVSVCGCKDVLQPGSHRVCNAYEYVTCVKQAQATFSRNGTGTCKCTLPCKNTEYSLQVSSAWYPRENYIESIYPNSPYSTEYFRANSVELRVYFQSKLYTQQTQVLEVTEVDVFASLGGFMGLFFGASCGTICELFELIFCIFFNMWKKKCNTKKT